MDEKKTNPYSNKSSQKRKFLKSRTYRLSCQLSSIHFIYLQPRLTGTKLAVIKNKKKNRVVRKGGGGGTDVSHSLSW